MIVHLARYGHIDFRDGVVQGECCIVTSNDVTSDDDKFAILKFCRANPPSDLIMEEEPILLESGEAYVCN